jgi:hypothetical protein
MAKLFLSYSRKDEPAARRLTKWLEQEGHDVWRDEDDIGGGASFSAEIEKALKDCDAVLVLWSAESVKSMWVRDEAGFARDAGKLIPLSLDSTEAPLGFRQLQAIGLGQSKGEPANADRIRRAIARVAGAPQSAPVDAQVRRRANRSIPTPLWAGALAIAAAALVAIFMWQRWSADDQIAITVLPSPASPDKAMAADYANVAAADMAAFLPRRFDRATVIAPTDSSGSASGAGYRMLISTDPHGAGANATVTLSDHDGHTTLWSHNWSVPDASGADLKAQVSASASKAALCLTDARGGRTRLTQPALGLYLSGCTGLGESRLSNDDFVTIFERVTKLAPDFGPGWGYLALSRSWIAASLRGSSPAAYAAALRDAKDAIRTTRKLSPDSALAYDAEFHLNDNDSLTALQILEKGAKVDPDYGMIQMHLSDELRAVGRMEDSVTVAERAVELEPGSPYTRYQYILALIYSGQFSKAKAEIAESRKKWPSDFANDLADFTLQFGYGDPRAALQLLPRVAQSSDAEMAPDRKVLAARLDPTPAKIDDAVSALEAHASGEPAAWNDVLTTLGTFGRIDQAYALMTNPRFQTSINPAVLFRPDFAGVRADPRFMQVAARLGLVRYWRQSGYWPDFCSTEHLKYDCKTEAAKYGG